MATVEKSIDVNVPISTAYNQWTQFETFPQFMSGVDSITQTSDTHLHWKVSIGGVDREFDAVVEEQKPDERVAWRSVDGESHAGSVDFHRLSDTETRVVVTMDWSPEGILEKAGAAVGVDDRQIEQDLKHFKEKIEGQGFEDGAWRGEVPRDSDATGR